MFLSVGDVSEQVKYFRKNIWILFFLMLAIALALVALISNMAWQRLYAETLHYHKAAINLAASSTKSTLDAQENLLQLIGDDLIDSDSLKDRAQSREILSKLIDNNPAIVGFGLASASGELMLTSDNFPRDASLPNLASHPKTADSFRRTLNTEKMVIGRTYFMPSLERWVMPIRKTLRDDKGEILAVMTAGLSVSGENSFIDGYSQSGGDTTIMLVREDKHIQYVSSNYLEKYPDTYDTTVLDRVYQQVFVDLLDKGHPKFEVQRGKQVFDIEINNRYGQAQLVSIKYMPDHQLWVVALTNKAELLSEFIKPFLIYSACFIAFALVLLLLFRRIEKIERERIEALEYKSYHDDLTGLPNLASLNKLIASRDSKSKQASAVFFVDIDNFKSANDSYGSDFGNDVLIEVARRLETFCGGEPDCAIFRVSGDEFIVKRSLNNKPLDELALALIYLLSETYSRNEARVILTASVGVACYPMHGDDIQTVIKSAEIAMLEAKKKKNNFIVFSETIHQVYSEKLLLEQELKHAIGSEQIFIHYQPQVNDHGQMTGMEALVRWDNPKLGVVPPDKFIKVAESSGLMPRLGHWLLELIFRDAMELDAILDRKLEIAINISATQFMQADFFEQFQKLKSHTQFQHVCFVLELTENIFIEDLSHILPKIEQLHQIGVTISLDDFGTGYSSLSLLRQLPIDELKIDKSFVDSLINDETARKMIRNIISIGEILELSVIAEGVETAEQMGILQKLNCHRFQGYHFSKPLPLQLISEKLRISSSIQA